MRMELGVTDWRARGWSVEAGNDTPDRSDSVTPPRNPVTGSDHDL